MTHKHRQRERERERERARERKREKRTEAVEEEIMATHRGDVRVLFVDKSTTDRGMAFANPKPRQCRLTSQRNESAKIDEGAVSR